MSHQAREYGCSAQTEPTFVRPLQHDKVVVGPVRLVALVDVVVELFNMALHALAPGWEGKLAVPWQHCSACTAVCTCTPIIDDTVANLHMRAQVRNLLENTWKWPACVSIRLQVSASFRHS